MSRFPLFQSSALLGTIHLLSEEDTPEFLLIMYTFQRRQSV
jgi:hypothetical protein